MGCRDRCRYAQHCYTKETDIEPDNCAMYYKLEDYMADAMYDHDDYCDKREEECGDAEDEE